jgi:type 1 glutamine amidotransferase
MVAMVILLAVIVATRVQPGMTVGRTGHDVNECLYGWRRSGMRWMVGYHPVILPKRTPLLPCPANGWWYAGHHLRETITMAILPRLLLMLLALPLWAGESSTPSHLVLLLAEDEYRTETTVPEFAERDLKPLGIISTVVLAKPHGSHDFPTLEKAMTSADLLFVSVRRRAPTAAQMACLKAHLAAGKAVVGIRTASHAFDAKGKAVPGHVEWPEFDHDVLGGSYQGHFGNDPALLNLAPGAAGHVVLNGVDLTALPTYRLYKNPTLGPNATALVMGALAGGGATQHVAWCNRSGSSRVFTTSLGVPEDFAKPAFQRLLRNGILWALGREGDIAPR